MSRDTNGKLIPVGGGDPIPLIRERLTVGRREPCDILFRFPNVSSRHCALFFHDGYWEIQDLGSSNGIKVNKVRTQKKPLKPGDIITIAKRDYRLDYRLAAGVVVPEEEAEVMNKSLLEKAGLAPSSLPDDEDGDMRPSLLEKAGLSHPRKPTERRPHVIDNEEFSVQQGQDDDDDDD